MRSIRSSRIVHVFFACRESLNRPQLALCWLNLLRMRNGDGCLRVKYGGCGLTVNKRWSSAH